MEEHNTLKTSNINRYKMAVILTSFACAFITLMVYLPALSNGFVNWDDPAYVQQNTNITTLDLAFFKWLSTAIVVGNYHPLTVFSLAIDYFIWGLDPFGYHLTNILLHALNTVIVTLLIIKLVKISCKAKDGWQLNALIIGGTTALIFSIHPLHVESVAWISSRNDLLYALFFLLSLLTYLKYAKTETITKEYLYLLTLFLFVLSALSKPMAVTLPLVLLMLVFYPLNRFDSKQWSAHLKTAVIEKIPFFAVSLACGIITILAQSKANAIGTIEGYPLILRLFNAAHSYNFYLYKMVVPTNLIPLYMHDSYTEITSLLALKPIASIITLIGISLLCIFTIKKFKVFITAWVYYLVTLLPVIGLLQVGSQSSADRYTYMTSIGPSILIGIIITFIINKYIISYSQVKQQEISFIFALKCTLLLIPVILLISTLATTTQAQIAIWKNSITLWSQEIQTLEKPPILSYYHRGIAYTQSGSYELSIQDFNSALAINPTEKRIYQLRGISYALSGDAINALSDFKRALEIDANYAIAYYSIGNVYSEQGKLELALANYEKALSLGLNEAEEKITEIKNKRATR